MGSRGKNNIEYQAEEPSFLRKLRAQQAGFDTDRHERPIARPRRGKAADDDDNEPTYVDEESNSTLSKEEYAALVDATSNGQARSSKENEELTADSLKSDDDSAVQESVTSDHRAAARVKQDLAEAGMAQKKRKIVKVVGSMDQEEEEQPVNKGLVKKSKKKAKAIALSFGDEET